jgi:hypothetical protein
LKSLLNLERNYVWHPAYFPGTQCDADDSLVTPLDNKFACLFLLAYSVVNKNRNRKPCLPLVILCSMTMFIIFIMPLVNELIRLG